MISCALLLLLAAKPPTLASPGFTSPNLADKVTTYFADHFAQALTLEGVRVVTRTEISTLLGFERQKQLLGCSSEASSCMAELADALGVDGIVQGTLAKVGKKFKLTLKVIASPGGQPLGIFEGSADDEVSLLDELTRGAKELGPVLLAKLRPPSPLERGVAREGGLSRFWWAPLSAGIAAMIAGGVLVGVSSAQFNALSSGNAAVVGTEPVAYARSGRALQTDGIIFGAVGAALVLTGVGMKLFGGSPVQPVAFLTPHGAHFALTVALP